MQNGVRVDGRELQKDRAPWGLCVCCRVNSVSGDDVRKVLTGGDGRLGATEVRMLPLMIVHEAEISRPR